MMGIVDGTAVRMVDGILIQADRHTGVKRFSITVPTVILMGMGMQPLDWILTMVDY